MKTKLTLLLIALFTTMGAWATDYTIHYKVKTGGAADPNGTFYNDGTANTNAWSNAWVSKKSTDNTMAGLLIKSSGSFNGGKALSGWNSYLMNGDIAIIAPVGYRLKSYTIKAKAYEEGTDGPYTKTITPAGKSTTTLNTSSDETIEVTGINAKTATFTVGGSETSNSRVIVSDLAVTVENVAGESFLMRYKDTNQYLYGTGFKKRTDRDVCVTITSTGSVDYDGYPTYKVTNPAGQYAVYSAATQSPKESDTRLSWNSTDEKNVYSIMYRGMSDFVRIKVARETEGENREGTYWTGWNNNNDSQVVFYTASDNLSNWQLIPVTPVSSLASTNRNKCYVIKTAERGNWAVVSNGTQLTRNLAPSLNIAFSVSDSKQQFAFIYHDGNYYLYSVSEKKFLSAASTSTNAAINLGRKATQSVSFVSTGTNAYPVCVEMSNTADLNVRSDSNEPGVVVYGTSGAYKTDGGNAVAIYEVGDFDPTEAENACNVRDVTYELYYNDAKVDDCLVDDEPLGPSVIPAELDNGLMTYTYTPSTIISSTETVRIDATWNGPFQISEDFASAKWYMVDMHSNENKYTWQYESSNEQIYTPVIGVTEFTKISDKNLWCFVGNPYDGFKIYNKAAGSTKTLRKATTGNTVSEMSTTDDHNSFKVYASSSIANACCFILDGDTHYLNKQTNGGVNKLCGWNKTDNGSSCRFFASGRYYLDALTPLVLDAPIGVVGTKSGIVNTSGRDALAALKTALSSDVFAMPSLTYPYASVNPIIDAVVNSDMISLGEGYYRVVSAVPGFGLAAAWYYNPAVSTTHIVWAKAATTAEHQVNSIFKFTANSDKWNIYSPNAQQSITEGNGTWNSQNAQLGTAEGLTVNSIGSAQYTFLQKSNLQTLHAQGHSNGTGSNGNLVTWNSNNPGEASTWYIVPVTSIDLTLNDGGDGNYYATACLPFDVTLDEACAYTLTLNGAKDGLTLSEAMSEVPAGTPVLLRHTANTIKASIASSASTGAPLTSTAMTGVYANTDVTEKVATDYFLGNGANGIGFYHWTGGTTLKANRAYFEASKIPGDVKAFYGFDFDNDDETGINSVNGSELMINGPIYNLAGQRLNKMQKGINIVNGKKVLK